MGVFCGPLEPTSANRIVITCKRGMFDAGYAKSLNLRKSDFLLLQQSYHVNFESSCADQTCSQKLSARGKDWWIFRAWGPYLHAIRSLNYARNLTTAPTCWKLIFRVLYPLVSQRGWYLRGMGNHWIDQSTVYCKPFLDWELVALPPRVPFPQANQRHPPMYVQFVYACTFWLSTRF